MIKQAEYIWLDGELPTSSLRSKTRIIQTDSNDSVDLNTFPEKPVTENKKLQIDNSDNSEKQAKEETDNIVITLSDDNKKYLEYLSKSFKVIAQILPPADENISVTLN